MASERRLLGVGALLLAGWAPSEARAWCQMTSYNGPVGPLERCVIAEDHPGSYPLAWRRRCTAISLSSAMPSRGLTTADVRGVFERSIAAWTTADCGGSTTGLSVDVLGEPNACERATHNRSGRNVHTIVFVQSGWSLERMHDSRAYAVTYVWHDPSNGSILDVDMEINEQSRSYQLCPETGCVGARVDLQNIVTHEMGHYFGLSHTPDDDFATMYAEAAPSEIDKRTLEADDVEGLCAIYPPGSLPTECNATPTGGQGLDCRAGSCGCAVPGAPARTPWLPLGLATACALLRSRRRA